MALLEQAQQHCERPTHPTATSSVVEREVLALLRRPGGSPPNLEEIIRKLLSSFSEPKVQNAISKLLREGTIEAVHNRRFKPGIVLIPSGTKASN